MILADLAECLPYCQILTNEDIGFCSDSKEAVAFAVLASEAISGNCNNVPSVTGAAVPVIMGKSHSKMADLQDTGARERRGDEHGIIRN